MRNKNNKKKYLKIYLKLNFLLVFSSFCSSKFMVGKLE